MQRKLLSLRNLPESLRSGSGCRQVYCRLKEETYATATAATSTTVTITETQEEDPRPARRQRRRTDGRDRSRRGCGSGLGTKRQTHVAQSSLHARRWSIESHGHGSLHLAPPFPR